MNEILFGVSPDNIEDVRGGVNGLIPNITDESWWYWGGTVEDLNEPVMVRVPTNYPARDMMTLLIHFEDKMVAGHTEDRRGGRLLMTLATYDEEGVRTQDNLVAVYTAIAR